MLITLFHYPIMEIMQCWDFTLRKFCLSNVLENGNILCESHIHNNIIYKSYIFSWSNPDNLTPNFISVNLEHLFNVLDIKPLDIFITNLKLSQNFFSRWWDFRHFSHFKKCKANLRRVLIEHTNSQSKRPKNHNQILITILGELMITFDMWKIDVTA